MRCSRSMIVKSFLTDLRIKWINGVLLLFVLYSTYVFQATNSLLFWHDWFCKRNDCSWFMATNSTHNWYCDLIAPSQAADAVAELTLKYNEVEYERRAMYSFFCLLNASGFENTVCCTDAILINYWKETKLVYILKQFFFQLILSYRSGNSVHREMGPTE